MVLKGERDLRPFRAAGLVGQERNGSGAPHAHGAGVHNGGRSGFLDGHDAGLARGRLHPEWKNANESFGDFFPDLFCRPGL